MNIKVRSIDTQDLSDLKCAWTTLHKKAKPTVFLSWSWIHALLVHGNSKFELVEVTENGKLVLLGVIGVKYKSLGVLRQKHGFLNRTGDYFQDQMWIEHNDFLRDKDTSQLLTDEVVSQLLSRFGFDTFTIGVSIDDVLPDMKNVAIKHVQWRQKGYVYELPLIKGSSDFAHFITELSALSKNTKRQVKRSHSQLLETFQSIRLEKIDDEHQSEALFGVFAEHHVNQWGNESGFKNQHFIAFHRQLILTDHAVIYALKGDNSTLCYLYFLLTDEVVSFYMSAIPAHSYGNKVKLGYLAHMMGMYHFYQQGYVCYDFLAGEQRYKASLSNTSYTMELVCYYKKSLKNLVFAGLQYVKRRCNIKPLTRVGNRQDAN